MAGAPNGWRQRWTSLVHRLRYGKVAPGSPEHLEILRVEEQRAEQVRKAMEDKRRFGKY